MILTPFGFLQNGAYPSDVNRTVTGGGSSCPRDPYHYQTGEAGYYGDTNLGEAPPSAAQTLGAAPNDFELARTYGYTGVHEGWTRTSTGLVPGGVVPPGYQASADPRLSPYSANPVMGFAGYPLRWPTSLGDVNTDAAAISPPIQTAASADFAQQEAEFRRKQFLVQVVTGAAVVASALFGIYRTAQLMTREKDRDLHRSHSHR